MAHSCNSANEKRTNMMRMKIARVLFGIAAALFLASEGAWAYKVTVTNSCAQSLFIRGADSTRNLLFGSDPNNQTNMLELESGKPHSLELDLPLPWDSGRIYGCWDDSIKDLNILNKDNGFEMQLHCGFVEFTVADNTPDDGNLFSNLSFVDGLPSKPIRIEAPDGKDCTNSGSVSAKFATNQVGDKFYWVSASSPTGQKECPTNEVVNGEFRLCLSANMHCSDATYGKTSDPVCSKLKGVIQTCIQDHAGCTGAKDSNTVDVYGCKGGFFDTTAGEKYCTAINRGVLTDVDKQDPGNFYKTAPYNDYAKFVHDVVGPIFAISYDDYPSDLHVNQGGYLNCRTSTQYNIEFCPDSSKNVYSSLGSTDPPGGNGGAPSPGGKLDVDEFTFRGKRGERVTLSLEKNGRHYGSAVLGLTGQGISRRTVGTLPKTISVILPRSGDYSVRVSNMVNRPIRYVGHYRLTMKSSQGGWTSLGPGRSVEN
jgi:hypothetical protein